MFSALMPTEVRTKITACTEVMNVNPALAGVKELIAQMVVNDRRISRILAAQPIRAIRCIFRCIREMLVCMNQFVKFVKFVV
jgi:hypothetical protein